MNDTIKLVEEIPELEVTDDGIGTKSQSVEKTNDEAQEKVEIEEIKESDDKSDDTSEKPSSIDDVALKGTALLKSLLSTSTAAVDKMITTTEVTDETLNLKKILYQPDEEEYKLEEPEESVQQINTSDTPADEDDRRLIIDISDEEKDGTGERKHIETPVPPLILREDENTILRRMTRPSTMETGPPQMRPIPRQNVRSQNSLPHSITYNLETSGETGITSSVKIDILANNFAEVPSSTDRNSKQNFQTSAKCANMTALDELNVIGHEIDKQMTKKTNEIVDCLTELLSGLLEKNTFLTKMSDATDTTMADLLAVSRKLVKRHKFEVNPNHKEFMRMKHLHFPTTSKDLVNYFDNLLPSLNKEKFLNMVKFYEIIIKEMLNLNKTKILQYLIDFMILRKNTQLDLLNYNFQLTSAPNLKQSNATVTKFQLPDSTQNPSEKRPIRLSDTSYNFIIRSDPIYLQAGSSFVTNHRDIITCRMSPRIQMRAFERKPFDNNMLKGRRIGRRLVVNSPEGDKFQTEFLRSRYPPPLQNESGAPQKVMPHLQRSPPIVVVSDTPPPSLPSEPSSPPSQKIPKALILSNQLIQPPHLEQQIVQNGLVKPLLDVQPNNPSAEIHQGLKRRVEYIESQNSADPLKNGQITMQEIQTLNQNGTEIIPTSILKNANMTRQNIVDLDEKRALLSKTFERNVQVVRRILPRGSSHEEYIKPSQPMVPKMPKRRQSCHERIMMPTSSEKESRSEATLEDSAIGKNYMKFLHDFERKKKQIEMQQRQTAKVAPQNPAKRVRFSGEADSEILRSVRAVQPPQVHYPIPQQVQLQQQQQQFMENQQRIAQFQTSPLRSPKQLPILNYKYYQSQLEQELRNRGLDPRVEVHQEPNRPLELVSSIPPERYHQHEQQRALYANQNAQKQLRQAQEKSQQHQQQQQQQQQQRFQPRSMPLNIDTRQQAAMIAMTAYHQLQTLHRDPSTLTPQQYAEHLKTLNNFKQFAPSAFTAYQRSPQQMEDPRILSEFYANTQDGHQMQTARTSPATYQVSSSSSRENSPNYDLLHAEPSLQRKLKYKAKSTRYVEPNPLSKPFCNPANSTYYTEPFASNKSKSNEPTSPLASLTAFRPPERHRSRSPIQRSVMENPSNAQQQQYQWMLAHAQAQAQAQVQAQAQAQAQNHVQNLALQNQPQRPMPRPAVASFLEPKVNGSSQLHSGQRYQEHQQPTEFLRTFYANQKNY